MVKVLVIDDQEDNLIALKAQLLEAFSDMKVLTASSGEEGLQIAHLEEPDVIFLDLVMPVMDGYETCKKIKENAWLKHIPVLILTAIRVDTQSRIQALEMGAEAFLTKPIDTAELRAQTGAMLRIKEAEGKLRQEKDLLEELVQRRTEALEKELKERKRAEKENEQLQAQLLQAQKMEAIGRLAGGVAHDFNNMLQAILGYTELLLMKVDSENPLRPDLLKIQKAAHHSAALTNQLMAFARKQMIRPQVLDLNQIVPNILKMLSRLIGEDILLDWVPGQNLGKVKMDPSQVNQILTNLMVNARDAIGGVGTITIETANISIDQSTQQGELLPGDYVLLALGDDGCGMEPEKVANIFEPFFTTKEVGEGTGLGLSMVYGIVKQNGGFIDVHSKVGKGTTFKIYLSRCECKVAEPTGVPSQTVQKGRATVLVVEDEKMILNITKQILQTLGYTVLTANTPESALSLAREYPEEIHLCLTDVVMPQMNGRKLAEQIKTFKPGVKILFMSGYTANVISHRGLLEEKMNFIKKPFSRETLGSKIQEILGKK